MSVDFSWGCWPSLFSTLSGSSLFWRKHKYINIQHRQSTLYLLVLSQAFDPETLSRVKEARETVLVYADLTVVDELHNA